MAKALSMAVGGANPLDQIPNLLRTELRNGLGATYFFIARHDHRRDANYRITDPDVETLLESVQRQGLEVALHGSYNSLDGPGSLASEFSTLRKQGLRPQGNRQHWLRFTHPLGGTPWVFAAARASHFLRTILTANVRQHSSRFHSQ
jgi:hypothetical protein